jgi:hypothetical protein
MRAFIGVSVCVVLCNSKKKIIFQTEIKFVTDSLFVELFKARRGVKPMARSIQALL